MEKLLSIWMLWMIEEPLRYTSFDDFTIFHHGDSMAEIAYQSHIMTYEYVGKVMVALNVFKELNNLKLNGSVKRRGGLVQDEQPRLENQCPCECNALPLSAGELMWDSGHEDQGLALPLPWLPG